MFQVSLFFIIIITISEIIFICSRTTQMCSTLCPTHNWALALTLCVLTTSDVGWLRLYKCTLKLLYSCTLRYICPGLTLNITIFPRCLDISDGC